MTIKVKHVLTSYTPFFVITALSIIPVVSLLLCSLSLIVVTETDFFSPTYATSIHSHNDQMHQWSKKKFFSFIQSHKEIKQSSCRKHNNGITQIEVVSDPLIAQLNDEYVITQNGLMQPQLYYNADAFNHLPIINTKQHVCPSERFLHWVVHLPQNFLRNYHVSYHDDFTIYICRKSDSTFCILCSCIMPFTDQLLNQCLAIQKNISTCAQYATLAVTADVRFENQIIVKKNKKGAWCG